MEQQSLTIKGMHCPACEMLITDVLEDFPKTKVNSISWESGVLVLDFDPRETSLEDIKKAIQEEGYTL